MSKSAIYTVMTTNTLVATNGLIPIGSTVRRYGCNIAQDGNTITITGRGYYKVTISATVAPTVAGTTTITLFKDGVAVIGATATQSTSIAGNAIAIPVTAIVKNNCDCDSAILSVVLSGAAANVSNLAVTVEKM